MNSNQNWEVDFKKITDITIDELVAFGFAFYAHWSQITINNLGNFKPLFFDKSTYFRNTILSQEKIRKALDIFCDDIQSIRDKLSLRMDDSPNWQLEFVDQRNKPLYDIPGIGIGIHGIAFLIEKITDNIYWTLLDNLPETKKEAFLECFGDIFEHYVWNILKRIFGRNAKKIKYPKAGNNKEAGDCIVTIKRHIFIFEIKSGRLIKDVHLLGNLESLINEYRRKLILRQLVQISKVVEDYKNGLFSVGNISYKEVKKIFPVCITLQQTPQLPPIREKLNDIMDEENILKDDKIQPFQILDAEEIEIMEDIFKSHFKKSKFLDLMKHKCGSAFLRDHSFKDFLYNTTSSARNARESDEAVKTFGLIADRTSQILFGKNRNRHN